MRGLVECATCSRHVLRDAEHCPFCDRALSASAPLPAIAAVWLLPLWLCGCEASPTHSAPAKSDATEPTAQPTDRPSADLPAKHDVAPPRPDSPTDAGQWGQQSLPPDDGKAIDPQVTPPPPPEAEAEAGTPEARVERPMYGAPPRPKTKYGAPPRPKPKYGAPPRPDPFDDL